MVGEELDGYEWARARRHAARGDQHQACGAHSAKTNGAEIGGLPCDVEACLANPYHYSIQPTAGAGTLSASSCARALIMMMSISLAGLRTRAEAFPGS